jgi:RHS repeat-associated protein
MQQSIRKTNDCRGRGRPRASRGSAGTCAAIQTDLGTVTLQLTDLHGDVVATVDDSTSASSIASYAESNEFGVPYFTSSAYPRYGWLGGKQRSHDTLASIVLMGVRLYDPNTGRFLQTDPVPGGSTNPYDYANQDPYNNFDLDGRWCVFGKNRNGSCRGARQVSSVTKHWRGVAQFGIMTAAVIVGGVIIAGSGGAGSGLAAYGVSMAIGAAAGIGAYGVGSGPHTRSGYVSAGVGGAISNVVPYHATNAIFRASAGLKFKGSSWQIAKRLFTRKRYWRL